MRMESTNIDNLSPRKEKSILKQNRWTHPKQNTNKNNGATLIRVKANKQKIKMSTYMTGKT